MFLCTYSTQVHILYEKNIDINTYIYICIKTIFVRETLVCQDNDILYENTWEDIIGKQV